MPPADFGAASGMTNVSQQVGGAIGLALLASLSAARARDLSSAGAHHAAALVGGDHLAFFVGTLAVTAGLIVSAVVLRSPVRPGDAAPAAHGESAAAAGAESAAAVAS